MTHAHRSSLASLRRSSAHLAVVAVLATAFLSVVLGTASRPAQAASSCEGHPFGWPNVGVFNLANSGNSQLQAFANPNATWQGVFRIARGLGSHIYIEGFEVGTDAQHRLLGSTDGDTAVPNYPDGWCSDSSVNRLSYRIAVTYDYTSGRRYQQWYQWECNPGCRLTGSQTSSLGQ